MKSNVKKKKRHLCLKMNESNGFDSNDGYMYAMTTKSKSRSRQRIFKKCADNKLIYWIGIIATFSMVHTVRNSMLISNYYYYSNDHHNNLRGLTISVDYNAPNPQIRSPNQRPRYQSQSHDRQVQSKRRRRTTPTYPLVSSSDSVFLTNYSIKSLYPSFPNEYVVGHNYCDKRYDRRSYQNTDVILISRILSHPLAFELALVLAVECGVTQILGLSDHVPTHEESFRYEFLMKYIPNLRIHISDSPLGKRSLEHLFEGFHPTYIFYFQSDSFLHSTDDKLSAFTTHAMIDELQQICNAIVKTNRLSEQSASFLHVTTNVPYDVHYAANTNTKSASIFSKLSPILLDTYRSQYQLITRKLNLPDIYGPFEGGSTWLHSDIFVQRTSMITDSMHDYDSISTSMAQHLVSVSKAIQIILVSGSLEHSNSTTQSRQQRLIPILAAAKSQTTQPTVNQTLLPIISWNYKDKYPYEDPSRTSINGSAEENPKLTKLALMNTRHHLLQKKTDPGISLLERRQHDLFPCISVCASFVQCHQLSVWNSVLSITKNVTAGCKYLLYTTNFSQTLQELPLLNETENKAAWPKESLCQLAFVSKNSTLVNNTIMKAVEQANNQASVTTDNADITKNWNGQVSNNGWKLIWVDKDENSLSEADYMMPKIMPESIVSDGVVKTFYLEPQHFEVLPSLQIIWFLMRRQLDAKARPTVTVPGGKQGMVPSRHIDLFTHTYNTTMMQSHPLQAEYITDAAKFILNQKGDMTREDGNFFHNNNNNRQFEVYSKSITWQNAHEKRSEFQLVDTTLMIYSVDSVLSKRLRCEWYEEHLFWNNRSSNRNLEELSLSYVLHRWRRRKRLLTLPNEDTLSWGEMIMLSESGQTTSFLPNHEKQYVLHEEEKGNKFLEENQHFVKLHNPLKARKQYLLSSSP